jgi:hypothetical protein
VPVTVDLRRIFDFGDEREARLIARNRPRRDTSLATP